LEHAEYGHLEYSRFVHKHGRRVTLQISQCAVGCGRGGSAGITHSKGGASLAQTNSQVFNQLGEMTSALGVTK
jgi:hypothetical protein